MTTSNRSDARRYGRFTVPATLAHQFSSDLKRVMGLCIVFRAEQLFHSDRIEYWAASEHFRHVVAGQVVPTYRWVFDEGHPRAVEVVDGAEIADAWPDEIDRLAMQGIESDLRHLSETKLPGYVPAANGLRALQTLMARHGIARNVGGQLVPPGVAPATPPTHMAMCCGQLPHVMQKGIGLDEYAEIECQCCNRQLRLPIGTPGTAGVWASIANGVDETCGEAQQARNDSEGKSHV